MPTREQVSEAVSAYVEAFNRGDRERFLSLWSPTATHVDPAGAPPNVGLEAIARFWDATSSLAGTFCFEVHDLHVCPPHAAMVFTMTTRSDHGGVSFDGVDVFTVDDQGRICSLVAYWDQTKLRPAP